VSIVKKSLLTWTLALALVPAATQAAIIAQEDFDGGAVGLVSSTVPALDGGSGDYFGVGSRNGWPQGFPTPGVPFSLADDTVVGYSNGGAAFPADNEGIFGQNSDFDNDYFAISDTREWTAPQLTASWTFDISESVDLALLVDLGGISSPSSGGYTLDTDIQFTGSIDGGASFLLFDVDAVDNTFAYLTRPMDVGTPSGGGRLLQVTGPSVTKLRAEDGMPAADTFVDKSVPSGAGQGLVDTFRAPVTGTGSTLTIAMTANVPFEAAAFDNIRIEGDKSVPANRSTLGGVKHRYR
jgi:hypothetical protein